MRRAFAIACVIVLVLAAESDVVHAKGRPVKPPAEAEDEVPWRIARIGADKVWGRTTGDGIKVAILDTGIASHEDLIIMGGINTVGLVDDNDPLPEPDNYNDTLGHGTMIAGMIAALDNEKGTMAAKESADFSVTAADLCQQHQRYDDFLLESG